mmetsp:Transcript_19435/g.28803  ORF Transcript_19435/g.28803 Transcript_19435/m.28803 type:complete len:917 (+) Transcript_19435:291-3041(+)
MILSVFKLIPPTTGVRSSRLHCFLRKQLHALSTVAESSDTSELERSTKILIGQSLVEESNVVALLKEWSKESGNESSKHMDNILQHWLNHTKNLKSTEPFDIVLKKHNENRNGSSAASLLDLWGEKLGGHLELSPPLSAFHLVLEAYSSTDNYQVCLDILFHLERSHLNGNYALKPTIETYSHVLSAIFKGQGPINNEIVTRMQDSFGTAPPEERQCPKACYHWVKAHSKLFGCGRKCEHPELMAWFSDFDKNLRQTDVLLNALLHNDPSERIVSLLGTAYISTLITMVKAEAGLESARRATEMLDYLESLKLEDLPWTEHFRLVISIWAQEQLFEHNAPEILQDLLHRYEDRHLSSNKKIPLIIYERIIWTWSQCGKAEKAADLLRHFMRLSEERTIIMSSKSQITRMFNYVLLGLFHENERKDNLLIDLWTEMQKHNVPRDHITYSAVLKAISTSRLPKERVVKEAINAWTALQSEAEIKTSARHYGSMISCWARVSSPGLKNAADKAIGLLDELENLYKESNSEDDDLKPHQAHFSSVITALARTRDPQSVSKVDDVFDRMKLHYEPDIIAYSSFLRALANGRNEESAKRAEEILDEMETKADTAEEKHLRPNTVTYTSVIVAHSNSKVPDAAEKAERILSRLEFAFQRSGDSILQPDSIAFGTAINAWSKTRDCVEAGERAEGILRRMEAMEKDSGKTLLNAIVYTNVIVAYWRSRQKNAADKALDLLEEMKNKADEGGNIDCLPDTRTYTSVLQTLARSSRSNKADMAWKILSKMCDDYRGGNLTVRPNVFSFTACLNACAHTVGTAEERKRAVELALRIMVEFNSYDYGPPSPAIYRTLLLAFSHQAENASDLLKYATIAFSRCCQEGYADDSILILLETKVPALYEKLPRNHLNQVEIPLEWSMNVKKS